jgi:hypothetical protein
MTSIMFKENASDGLKGREQHKYGRQLKDNVYVRVVRKRREFFFQEKCRQPRSSRQIPFLALGDSEKIAVAEWKKAIWWGVWGTKNSPFVGFL